MSVSVSCGDRLPDAYVGSEQDEQRANLFRRAIARHVQYAAWAADGQGVDRHLFGLKKMVGEGEPVPELYSDEAFSRTNHWELSTSQLSSPYIDGWGYGEGERDVVCCGGASADETVAVVPDGYGLSYAIGDEHIRWTITSERGDSAVLKHYLAEAATEVRALMAAAESGRARL